MGELGSYESALNEGAVPKFIKKITKRIVEYINNSKEPLVGVISDNFQKGVAWELNISENETYIFMYTYRRLGLDNGVDTFVYLDNNIRMALYHLEETLPD
ncbi:hypothetical protein [Stappia indica]|uniref:hypothetical protein n=1 Tax=Stappia indica TaxID=538381 RepID=UPI00114675FF|nr:hypothetical protein [Stappia indica]